MMLSKRFRQYIISCAVLVKIILKLHSQIQIETLHFELLFLSISMRTPCERKLSLFQCSRTYGILANPFS